MNDEDIEEDFVKEISIKVRRTKYEMNRERMVVWSFCVLAPEGVIWCIEGVTVVLWTRCLKSDTWNGS